MLRQVRPSLRVPAMFVALFAMLCKAMPCHVMEEFARAQPVIRYGRQTDAGVHCRQACLSNCEHEVFRVQGAGCRAQDRNSTHVPPNLVESTSSPGAFPTPPLPPASHASLSSAALLPVLGAPKNGPCGRMQANANRRPACSDHTYVATSSAARLCEIKLDQPFRKISWYGVSTSSSGIGH
jgi:hypothetical protein